MTFSVFCKIRKFNHCCRTFPTIGGTTSCYAKLDTILSYCLSAWGGDSELAKNTTLWSRTAVRSRLKSIACTTPAVGFSTNAPRRTGFYQPRVRGFYIQGYIAASTSAASCCSNTIWLQITVTVDDASAARTGRAWQSVAWLAVTSTI